MEDDEDDDTRFARMMAGIEAPKPTKQAEASAPASAPAPHPVEESPYAAAEKLLTDEQRVARAAAQTTISRHARGKATRRSVAERRAKEAAQAAAEADAKVVIGQAALRYRETKAARAAAKAAKEQAEAVERAKAMEAQEAEAAQLEQARKAKEGRIKAHKALPEAFHALPQGEIELIEALCLHVHAQERRTIGQLDLEIAALARSGDGQALRKIWEEAPHPGQERAVAIRAAVGKLEEGERAVLESVSKRVGEGSMPILSVTSAEPLELTLSEPSLQDFFCAEALCSGLSLPPESRPWQWPLWWERALDLGGAIGGDFESGLLKASTPGLSAKSELPLRSKLTGHRSTALRSVSMLLRAVVSVDLRDNRLTDEEVKLLCWPSLADSRTLTRLNLAGNRLTPEGVVELTNALSANGRLRELDLSRNKFCGPSAEAGADAAFTKLSAMAAESGELTGLMLSGVDLSDDEGCVLMDAFAEIAPSSARGEQPAIGTKLTAAAAAGTTPSETPERLRRGSNESYGGGMRTLMRLELSRNQLGKKCAQALAAAVPMCPRLAHLDLSHNKLGVDGGRAIASVMLAASVSLKYLNIAANNLCNVALVTAPPASGSPTGNRAGAAAAGGKEPALFTKGAAATATGVQVPVRGEWTGEAIVAICEVLPSMISLGELVISDNGLCGLWVDHICGTTSIRGNYTSQATDALVAVLENSERLSFKPMVESIHLGELVEKDFIRKADEERIKAGLKANGRKVAKSAMSSPSMKGSRGSAASSMRRQTDKSFKDSFRAPSSVGSEEGDGRKFEGLRGAGESVLDMAARLDDATTTPGKQRKPQGRPLEGAEAPAAEGAAEGDEDDAEGGGEAAPAPADAPTPAVAVAVPEPVAPTGTGGGHEKAKKGVPKLRGGKSGDGDGDGKGANPFAAKSKRGGGTDSPRAGGKAPNSARGKRKDGGTPRTGGGSGLTPRGNAKRGSGEPAASHRPSSSAAGGGDEKPGAATERVGGRGSSSTSALATKAGNKKKKKEESIVEEAEVNPFASAPMMIALAALKATEGASLDTPQVGGKVSTGSLMRVAETQDQDDGSKRMLVALDGDVEALGWVTGLTKDLVENLKLAAAGFPLMKVTRTLVCRETKENSSKKLEEVAKDSLVRVMERAMMPDGTEKALVAKDGAVAEPHGWVAWLKASKEGEMVPNLIPVENITISFDLKVHSAAAMVASLERKKAAPPVRKRNDGGWPVSVAGRRPPNRLDAETPSRHRHADKPASLVLLFNCHNAAFEITAWSSSTPFDKLPGEQQFDLVSKKSRKRLGMVRLAKELGMPFLERVDFPDDWIVADEHGLDHDGWQGAATLDLELTWGKDVATMRVHPWLAYGCSVGARFLVRKTTANNGQCATVQRILADDRVVARVDGYSKNEGVKGETIVDVMPATLVRTTLPAYKRDTKLLLLHNNKLVDATVLAWLGSDHLEEGSRHMVNIKQPGAPFGSQAWPALNNFNHVVAGADMSATIFEASRMAYCQFLIKHEDKVEDAITGNSLEIKDQLIFMTSQTIVDGCSAPEYMNVPDVPELVKLLVADSPKRHHGQHSAQPVLCRAGPGTGKTWMIKQCMFLLACYLGDHESNDVCSVDGVRLVPVIVFVQRIVRLLREHGDDPSTLLADPDGMMRWYISNEFIDRKEERTMLLQAWEIRALVILVDGVDEAAGLRDIVEAFVHYELVPSGNRLVVTSRPEGVDLDDYKTRFVVMNLLELTQEQQRNVIQMQLQGNAFFEHLVNIAECRKDMDSSYRTAFRSEMLRSELEVVGIPNKDPVLIAADEAAKAEKEAASSGDGAGTGVSTADGNSGGIDSPGKRTGRNSTDERAARASKEELPDAEKGTSPGKHRRGSAATAAGAASGNVVDTADAEQLAVVQPMTRRRMSMDNNQDPVDYLAKIDLRMKLRSSFLEQINRAMLKTSKAHGPILDQYETELRTLPTPCTRSAVEATVTKLAATRGLKDGFAPDQRNALVELGMQRKLPVTGGRRGAKAAPMTALGLWWQVLQHTDKRFVLVEQLLPTLRELLAAAASACGIRTFGSTSTAAAPATEAAADGSAPSSPVVVGMAAPVTVGDGGVHGPQGSFRLKPASELSESWLQYREPVSLWLESTYTGATEPVERPPEAWCATVVVECETGEQCLQLMRKIQQGIEVGDPESEAYAKLKMQRIENKFAPECMHPTHLRSVECEMLLTTGGQLLCILVQVQHRELLAHYRRQEYSHHYDFFLTRVMTLSRSAFDQKFESLLVFLVEAIGVPVLLSLLLLTYSDSSSEVIDLDQLPVDRLQLYKFGITSGIRKRLLFALQNEQSSAAEAKEEEKEEQVDGRPKREKRKGALELTMGGGGGVSSGPSESDSKAKAKVASNEPILDLNSVLRGKKVRVVTGEDDVAEAYSLVVRVLDKVKGADLRTAITAVVPKSHSMHAPVTALVEYVINPIGQSESMLQECGKKMLRRVAVDNQEAGRREFTSKHVACTLGANPEELGLWTRLEMDHDHGVALCATLAKQSDKAPAQYQFKHLSFQEGLYAEHLLLLVTSLAPPQGNGWSGWIHDKAASEFLNNRYMNNTCRIAAGHLGALLATQRSHWDFRESPLTANGRSALWFITDDNDMVESINVAQNDVSSEDVEGLAQMLRTCTTLKALDLSENDLQKLVVNPKDFQVLGDALGGNKTLQDLNLNQNRLGSIGVRIISRALLTCTGLKRLGLSFNEPGVEPALADLLRAHPALVTVELVEALDRHLPSRAKDDIGRALSENKAKTVGFLHCDTFVLGQDTRSLVWPKEASTSDAVLLAGVLVTNTVLTTFNIASGAQLANSARSSLGEALLNNPGSRVAFCNDFGLTPSTDTCEFDLSRTELKDVEPFRLLAGCLRGNRTLTHVTLKQLRSEQIPTLALALRGNATLAQLDIIHLSRLGGQSVVRLPVPDLNGSRDLAAAAAAAGDGGGDASNALTACFSSADGKRVDMTTACIEGNIGRVACEMIGTLIAANTRLECLDLSNTGLGLAIGSEGEGGHIVLKPLCDSKVCPLHELNLSNIQLNDKAGSKLLASLSQGLGKKMNGYDKLTSLSLAGNELGKQTGAMLKECLWGERAPCMLKILDLSGNTGLDGYDTALAIKRNISLTSVDIRQIPSANTDAIYTFLGSFLLQDECACRLGFLSCDAFQLVHGLEALDLKESWRESLEMHARNAEGGEGGDADKSAGGAVAVGGKNVSIKEPEAGKKSSKGHSSDEVPGPVLMLLAGVLKFNSSLKNLSIKATGFDDVAAGYFYSALVENKVLVELDISSNPVDAEGIAEIAEAVRVHPALESVRVDGAALPVAQLRGSKGHEETYTLDVADWQLKHLSGHMIGAITRENKSLLELNLKHNTLGASGAAAVVAGLGDSPLRTLDLTRNGLGEGSVSQVNDLAVAICQKLGSLLELKLDENDLDCPAEAIAPVCKLRHLRVLSLEKNKLSAMPALIGTMFSLKAIRMHSNQISELPASICLLTSLENLDVHKNMLKTLPQGVGQLRALQKLDLSENRLVELPITICELSETLQLSVGRNPLEKPSIEQARQGVGSIRRFFGWSRKREEEAVDEIPKVVREEDDESRAKAARRPSGRPAGAPSRHDWAQPAGIILLFNCVGCTWQVAEGSADLASIPSDEKCDMFASFNLQKVGRVRESKKTGEGFAERVEFIDQWLPWKTQDVGASEHPKMVIQIRWTVSGVGKQSASIVITPWLSYGVSVGARVRLNSNGEFATVVRVRDDDQCDLICDNAASQAEDRINPARIHLDVQPGIVSRTSSPSYKAGQKLLLILDGVPVDAIVEEWLGLRRGSRHRVRIGGTKAAAGSEGGKAADGSADAHIVAKRVSVADGKHGTAGGKQVKETIEVDLNETNHTKLLFPTVAKYEDAKSLYCERIIAKYATFRDDASAKDFKVIDQRVFVRPSPKLVAPVEADKEEDANKMGDANGGGDRDGNDRDGSPGIKRIGSSPFGARMGAGSGRPSFDRPTSPSSPPESNSRSSSPAAVPEEPPLMARVSTLDLLEQLLAEESATASDASAPPSPDGRPPPQAPPQFGKAAVVAAIAAAAAAAPSGSPSLVVKTSTLGAHELLKHQALYALTRAIREASSDMAAARLVPLHLPVGRLAEYMSDEMLAKQHPRTLIVKAFETDYPGHSDALKQAMEMRALIVVAEVSGPADLAGLKEAVLEELALNRLVVIMHTPKEVPGGETAAAGPTLPKSLLDRSACWDLTDIGFFLSDLKLAHRPCKDILRRLRLRDEATEHYSLVSSVHLGGADFGREAAQALQELLQSEQCTVRALDVSYSNIDGYQLITSVRSNASLTSLDVRGVPIVKDLFKTIGDNLLGGGSPCKLCCLRCDQFELVEGQTSLSLRERPFVGGELRLLIGLIKHNPFIEELDLSATDLESDAANLSSPGTYEMQQLSAILGAHPSLRELKMEYNPAIDQATREKLRSAAAKEESPINLLL